jgi:hypothetical protein
MGLGDEQTPAAGGFDHERLDRESLDWESLDRESPDEVIFVGDLFLKLAVEGRLVLDAVEADRMITALEATLAVVRARTRLLEFWRQLPRPAVDGPCAAVEQFVVDILFTEQVAPGRLERALQELPTYIEAFKLAKRRRIDGP